MNSPQLTDMGRLLEQSVRNSTVSDDGIAGSGPAEPTIHVPHVGNVLLTAYEQLRIASENIEDHLLFQSALKRFYMRNLTFVSEKPPRDLANELIIELTLAGYLKNDSVAKSVIGRIDELIAYEYASYWAMLKSDERLRRNIVQNWVIEALSVRTEQIFNSPVRLAAFVTFAYQHFDTLIDVGEFVEEAETTKITAVDYPFILFIAIHKSLLRSNDANIRNAVYEMVAPSIHDADGLVSFHIKYDRLAGSKTASRVSQAINRAGAPLRIVRAACFDRTDASSVPPLHDKAAVQEAFSRVIDEHYKRVRENLRAGVIKSIVFLLITKALIGLLVEVPYDLIVLGHVALLPLIINLLFPPVFIAVTGFTIKVPGSQNKQAILSYVSGLLYKPASEPVRIRPPRRVAKSRAFNVLYAVLFLAVFYAVASLLAWLGFNLVQGIIFFIFLSTASFLGYRLALQVREYEMVSSADDTLGLLRDTFYAPFIVVGRRISYRFARLNIVAQVLDNVIELPLTTVLRLLRQWTAFLRTKQDEIGG